MRELAVASGLFGADDVGALEQVLAEHLAAEAPEGRWSVVERVGRVVGAGYWAPEPFGDRVWNLYFLAVDPAEQGTGVGAALVRHVRADLVAAGSQRARVLLVETSSTDQYAGARAFYAALGFEEEARVRDFYGPADDKVVFWWRVAADGAPQV